jgi:uncharacterized membrane protein
MNAGSPFSRKLLGLLLVVAGVLHFLAPGGCERIMPPYLPLHRELVYLSGAAEILGGLGLLPKRTRRAAGIGLVLLLIAVWPANVQMLIDARASQEPRWWLALLWGRLPLQVVLIAWVWRASHPRA